MTFSANIRRNAFFLFFLCMLTSGCSPEPIELGFVGGISGRGSDLGVAARNGAMLAVEERNAAGGVNGRQIRLLVRDDEQNPETARRVVCELVGRDVECILGPLTSSVAMALLPVVNSSKTILLSPLVTTRELTGKDDNFLRVISSTTTYAGKSARYQYDRLGRRSVAVIYDVNNRSYAESWMDDFRSVFEGLGGTIAAVQTFSSGNDTNFSAPARKLLAARADSVLIVSNAMDAAMICQQIRKLDARLPVAMSEWASTERSIELAGKAADGVTVAQFLNRADRSPRYLSFRSAYVKRFGQEPGFAGLAGYDAALVALEAIAGRKGAEPLKEAILKKRTFQCVQQTLTIDRFGDADRSTYITVVRDGRFVTLE
jgi:branched-chain amino acid transport system substrate-binding protein